jgi:hypothetical protein
VQTIAGLSPPQIALLAVCASLIAAFISAVVALTVAAINAFAARSLARAAARRDYRRALLKPLLDTASTCSYDFSLVYQALGQRDHKGAGESLKRLAGEDFLLRHMGFTASVISNRVLNAAAHRFVESYQRVLQHVTQSLETLLINPQFTLDETEMRNLLSSLFDTAFAVHRAAEDFIVRSRPRRFGFLT